MNSETSTNDLLTEHEPVNRKLPSALNVLTILTFVGCAYELYSTVSNFIKGRKGLEEFDEATTKMADGPAWIKNTFASPQLREVIVKGYENRIPLLIIGLVSLTLCVYGAIEMRKMKKQGYNIWLIGEILPIISMVIFIGGVFFQTIFASFLFFPALFILLYTLQRKHLS